MRDRIPAPAARPPLVRGRVARRVLVWPLAARIVLVWALAAPAAEAAPANAPQIGGQFTLATLEGTPVNAHSFAGRWQLIYFGFTQCPDVCPTVLNQVGAALQELGPLAERVQPLFISIDPDRDTAPHLRTYLDHFDHRIQGLRGTRQQTDAAARAYRVYVKDRPLSSDGSAYGIDHSSFLFLMAPDGRFARLLQADGAAHPLASQLRSFLQ